MGLSSSKHRPSPRSSSSEASARRTGSSGRRVLKSDCLRSNGSDSDDPKVSDSPSEENGKTVICAGDENKSSSCHVSSDYYTQINPKTVIMSGVNQASPIAFLNKTVHLQMPAH